MPREGSISVIKKRSHRAYEFTSVGLAELQKLAAVGSPPSELARFFGVSEGWIVQQLKQDGPPKDVYEAADSDGVLALRLAQQQAALSGDTAMLKWLGKQRLGQKDKTEHLVEKKITVIGALPDFTAASEDWAAKFVPEDVVASRALPTPMEGKGDGDDIGPNVGADCAESEKTTGVQVGDIGAGGPSEAS